MRPMRLALPAFAVFALACGSGGSSSSPEQMDCSVEGPGAFTLLSITVEAIGPYADDSLIEGESELYIELRFDDGNHYSSDHHLGTVWGFGSNDLPQTTASYGDPLPVTVDPCTKDAYFTLSMYDHDFFADDLVSRIEWTPDYSDGMTGTTIDDDGTVFTIEVAWGEVAPEPRPEETPPEIEHTDLFEAEEDLTPCVSDDGIIVDDWYIYVGTEGATVTVDTIAEETAFSPNVATNVDIPGDWDLFDCTYAPPGGSCTVMHIDEPGIYPIEIYCLDSWYAPADPELGEYTIYVEGDGSLKQGADDALR